MTYFEHKLRLFSSVSEKPNSVSIPHNRRESRLKTYSSNTDFRSWSLEEDERRKFMLNLMNPPDSEKVEWKYVSICAIIAQLYSFHERQVCNLENMVNDLTNVLRNALPQLGDEAMKETQQMLDNFSNNYGSCLRYFRKPLDMAALLCESEGNRSVYTDTEYSGGSMSLMDQTMEEDVKMMCEGKDVNGAWNKISEESIMSSESETDSEGKTTAKIDESGEPSTLKEAEEKLKALQEESKADKAKISNLEQLICAANCKIKVLLNEKKALKLKLTQHESGSCCFSSEEEALKKIYITENRRMREELEGLEQMCWRIKQVLQWVIKERDCYKRRCAKLEFLANEIDDLKCEMEAWRFTEQERCRLEKVVHHLKHVLQEQDYQLKHLLCHIEVLSQQDRESRRKSCDDFQCPSQESVSDSSQKSLLCLPSTSEEKLKVDKECAGHLALKTRSRSSQRHRAIDSTINNLFSQRSRPRNFMFLNPKLYN